MRDSFNGTSFQVWYLNPDDSRLPEVLYVGESFREADRVWQTLRPTLESHHDAGFDEFRPNGTCISIFLWRDGKLTASAR